MLTSSEEAISSKLREPVRFLVFAASLRGGSFNSQLAELARQVIEQNGGKVDWATMSDFDSISFNEDVQKSDSFPPQAEEFRCRLEANDAFIIASPEYNGSIPGVLKNAIDWVSRYRPQPFNERHGLLLSASPSFSGGNRGLWSLRIPLEHLGARVFPDMFSLAQAHKAFAPGGGIANEQLSQRFELTIRAFMELAEAAKRYPCAKKAWFEFLGQPTDVETARVE